MSQLMEYEGTWEELAMREPEFRGKKLKLTVLEIAEPQEAVAQYAPAPSPEELLELPFAERERILAAQAALLEEEYRTNPDLTAFEAFGPNDLYDEYPENAFDK